MNVHLDKMECLCAAMTGVMRNLSSVFSGHRATYGSDSRDNWRMHIEGAGGELACAKAMDVYWPASVNTFSAPDIGDSIQVRTRSESHYDLIVREGDNPEHRYILVTGQMPDFKVVGWIDGKDARQEVWWQTYGNRPGAWFVPQEALKRMEDWT